MPPAAEPTKSLLRLFRRQKVVELTDLFAALGTHSRMTVFRRMVALDYLSSYSHAGRYYTLPDIPQFDEHGLWQHAGAFFSHDGTLKETVVRLVDAAPTGEFQRDLQVRLKVRVHNTLTPPARTVAGRCSSPMSAGAAGRSAPGRSRRSGPTHAILPKLTLVEQRFGAPCPVMRDLGKAVSEAARDFTAARDPKIPELGCHLHFLKDIGKDLLSEAHDDLRGLFRRFKVASRLRTLARDLGRGLGADIEKARTGLMDWLAEADERPPLPEGDLALAVVRALPQWILDYANDGTDAGFLFDQPQLDLYRRCRRACRAAESLLRNPPGDRRVTEALERLHRIIAPVRADLPFQQPARIIESRASLFDELRDSLRLKVKRPTGQGDTGRSRC